MLIGFKRRFAPFVEDGSKTHTIRAIRRIAPKVGEMCHCYVDPRQKTMRLLGRWPCVKVEDILIYERAEGTFGVFVDNVELTPDEKDALAWRDGFRSYNPNYMGAFVEMMRFWSATHGEGRRIDVNSINHPIGEPVAMLGGKALDFHGIIIHWKGGAR